MTRLYLTKAKAELLSEIPIADGTLVDGVKKRPYQFLAILKLKLPDLVPGEKVLVATQFEATNPHQFNVMFSHMLTRGAPGEVLKDKGWTVIVPARRAGENISPNTHHSTRVLIGGFEVKEAGTDTVRVVAWASARRSVDGDMLVIDQGQGGICAFVFGQGDAPPVSQL